MLCSKCGHNNRDAVSFCSSCGSVLSESKAPPTTESIIQELIKKHEMFVQDWLDKLYGKNGKTSLVLARCTKTKQPFGMRFQESEILPSYWWLTEAFELRGETAQHGGYEASEQTGRFGVHPEYSGCPYCQAKNFYRASCTYNLACWDGVTNPAPCPWCNKTKSIEGFMTGVTKVTDF